jgi:hypothetical protein
MGLESWGTIRHGWELHDNDDDDDDDDDVLYRTTKRPKSDRMIQQVA